MTYSLVENPFESDDLEALRAVLDSGQFTMGSKVKKFEQIFAETIGSPYAVMVNSGSSANLIALASLFYRQDDPLQRGDEVLVPAVGWATTWAPLQQMGLRVKVVDINSTTLNVDVDAYRKALTARTRMIVTVSILGNPLDFCALKDLCTEKNLILLEDNCESIGATVNNQNCGTFGTLGTFSFFYSHHISTMEGGMIVTADQRLFELCLKLRAHGWERDAGKTSALNRELYEFSVPGYNVRPLEFSGALGLSQLRKLPAKIEGRKTNAKKFLEIMRSFREIQVQETPFGTSSWYAFTMVLKEAQPGRRDRLIEHLKAHGIESRMITGGCLTRHPMKKYFELAPTDDLIHAEHVHDHGLFVANHASPLDRQLLDLQRALESFGVK